MTPNEALPASYRDPSGFLFRRDGILYRQVNSVYAEHYAHLMQSGFYDRLTSLGLLVRHEECDQPPAAADTAFKIIKPELVPFVSYSYEWCFGQLKDAALVTLEIQGIAIEFGMTLKDASAFNIQFLRGRPALIDTLSFEKLAEGRPWIAYRQFCEHFLAPLALMSLVGARLGALLQVHPDGVPLDLASKMLPARTRLSPPLLMHIHLHANSQTRLSDRSIKAHEPKMSRTALMGIIDSLRGAVRKLNWRPPSTVWSNYYETSSYSTEAFEKKKLIVEKFLQEIKPATVWDIGANDGAFSRIAARLGAHAVAFDIDPAVVERNYQQTKADKEENILPLLLDIVNPTPGIGWANVERDSILSRGPADAVLALAIVHHLAITHNVPFSMIAELFARMCRSLVVEFIPKTDPQVQRLLASRDDIFGDYDQERFETEFGKLFSIESSSRLPDSERIIYLMRKTA